MKELTVQEKAKAYNEAIERAKKLMRTSTAYDKFTIEKIFPELKEEMNKKIKACIKMCLTDANEQRFKDYNTTLKDCLEWLENQEHISETHLTVQDDKSEEISKEIIKYLEQTVPHHHRDEVLKSKEWIAWLEKQKPAQNINKEDEEVRQYIIRTMEQKDINVPMVKKALSWLERQAEKKQEQYDIDVLEKHITKDSISELAHTVIVRNGWEIADAKEQKPAEWSEEDENTIKVLMNIIKKSEIIDSIIYTDSLKEKLYDWLKFLKERYTWKPSDEQMNALSVTVKHGQTDDPDALKKLLEQLKKLRKG